MAEQLTVYEPGDRFATMGPKGLSAVYEVAEDGHAYVRDYTPACENEIRCKHCGDPLRQQTTNAPPTLEGPWTHVYSSRRACRQTYATPHEPGEAQP